MALRTLGSHVRTLDTSIARPLPKETDPHYGTAAHKRWAKAVGERAGYRCQDPEHRGERLVCRGIADHIEERKDGGASLDLANGMYRCWPCHGRKTAKAKRERMQR